MTKPIERDPVYRGRRFQTETIELCVRWYITYRLSYRDLVAMMAERGVIVSHTTIMRWVLRYVPEYEERWNRFSRRVNSSWRMDETAIRIHGKSAYLYRAVDKHGNTVDSLLREDRGIEAAKAFFRRAVITQHFRWPRNVTLDGHAASHRALDLLREENPRWRTVRVRSSRYLNNIVEQDHRAIKRRCAPMLGFKGFANATVTIAGIELAHRVRKQQFFIEGELPRKRTSMKELWDRALALSPPSCPCPCPRRRRLQRSRPRMHQNSETIARGKEDLPYYRFRRYPRKIFDGRGLYRLLMPNGSCYWRYNYRFEGKFRTVALGVYPDVSVGSARARHQVVRSLLAEGIDPAVRKRELGKCAFQRKTTLKR
jgi:transposase-like protein